MKAWLCTACRKVFFGDLKHSCRPVPILRSGLPEEDEKVPAVGVPHIASVRKWCES